MESELEKIIDRILRDASEEAESINKEARKAIEAEFEKQKALGRQKALKEAEILCRTSEDKMRAKRETVFAEAKLKASWMVLAEKNHAIDRVLEEGKARLEALANSKDYTSILEKIIVDAATVMGGGELEVLLSDKDSSIGSKPNMLRWTKLVTKETGKKTSLRLSGERIKAIGGAIVKTVDGILLVDNTFEARLKRSEPQLRLKVAKILFR